MSLLLGSLEKVRQLGNGVIQARCPACAEGGHDRAGEHLRIYPDGRYGCCVYPKDHEHRKRIFALAGDRAPRTFTVKLPAVKVAGPAVQSVKQSLAEFARTLRTPVCESVTSEEMASYPSCEENSSPELPFRTFRTGIFQSRTHTREEQDSGDTHSHTCKDWEKGVLSVLEQESVSSTPIQPKLPFLTADGTLSIPFSSPERYHWWKGGQSIAETMKEVKERSECDDEY